jgi:hypothetical protein
MEIDERRKGDQNQKPPIPPAVKKITRREKKKILLSMR